MLDELESPISRPTCCVISEIEAPPGLEESTFIIASRTSPGRRRFLLFWFPFGTLASLRRLDVSVNDDCDGQERRVGGIVCRNECPASTRIGMLA
jgi:hypothetical protein